jgi:hypothetical protein
LMATQLPRYHTICAISKPALSSMGQLMQPGLKAGGEATLKRWTRGCGNLPVAEGRSV